MSAPDIGALRALNAAAERARCEYEAASMAFGDACRRAIAKAFGSRGGGWTVDKSTLYVRFDDEYDSWVASGAADGDGPIDAWVSVKADTPRAAVDQALAALAQTHPVEADALAAVIPKEPAS